MALDVALPPAVVTTTDPVVAPTGTCVVRRVGLAVSTGAATPLNVIWLAAGLAPNPAPKISTLAPTAPTLGVTSVIESVPPGCSRRIDRILPTSS